RGKTQDQLRLETLDHLRNIAKSESSIQWTLDFRGGLLRQARRLRRMEKREEPILYYATWIEHMLNGMIATVFRRRKLSDEWVRDFIRETQLKAKLDRKSTRLNSSQVAISYAVFCLKKKITRI